MIFVDTSAFYAILDRDDELHQAARTLWQRFVAEDAPLATSNYVLVECFALIQARLGLPAVRAFHQAALPLLRVLWIGLEDHQAAVHALLTANRRGLSLVDCSSFQLMHRHGLRCAFAFDRHFAEQGFDLLSA